MARSPSLSPSPPPADLDSTVAHRRLAQLEALLASALFDETPSASPSAASPAHPEPPQKRKKTDHARSVSPVPPRDMLAPEETVGEYTQKRPQQVVLRDTETPPPVVLDRRIRDVDDEDPAVVQARREAIRHLAMDGETILAQSQLAPMVPPPAHQLSHRSLSASCRPPASNPLPRLAYLNARLPASLLALSPHPVPFPEELEVQGHKPPLTPHEGLLAVAPLPGVYARAPRTRRFDREGKQVREFVALAEGGPRKGLPPRNPILKAAGGGTQDGRCALVIRPILPEEQPGGAGGRGRMGSKGKIQANAGAGTRVTGSHTKTGKRLSKVRRARARRGAAATA